ncbi:MAG: ferredoxin family protein [Archaeoglobales archaeon]|jgi:NAD-dependent dihydropyrimidine dehydrogenase PreA subunit|nr:ferredoxin family protein [Archaeoglobi archaeon]NHW23347.1 ferredoxin family protein [Archaeoglobales archaeon]TDA24952.1 MAG: 4Fe-4S ferredoxin [Archaeoglobi archaeon]TDA25335.1 MAG: 4Fe-4S ferredoxin [Archaeoglobi archaeon]
MAKVTVDTEKCSGCGECISVCPGSVFEFNDEGKSNPVRPDDCQECCSCVEVCPESAIKVDVCE